MNKSTVFVAHDFDLVDWAKLSTKVVAQRRFVFILVQLANVDVTSGVTVPHGDRDRWGQVRFLAPADTQSLSMKGEALDLGVGVECCSGGTVEEGDEYARLVLDEMDAFDWTKANQIEELVNRGIYLSVDPQSHQPKLTWRKRPDIYRPAGRVASESSGGRSRRSCRTIVAGHLVRVEKWRQELLHW